MNYSTTDFDFEILKHKHFFFFFTSFWNHQCEIFVALVIEDTAVMFWTFGFYFADFATILYFAAILC